LSPPALDQPFVSGSIETAAGRAPVVSADLKWEDRWGTFKVRWGRGRMNYKVDPGLYALGRPDGNAPVLVTANYKMSFDRLRESLPGRDAWILALDTKGINVWCAAGKGTFGAEELARRVKASGLERVVAHRRLILPQLGAPGIAAHKVNKQCGFKPEYGPIKASDLPAFLDNRGKATPEMRRKTFTLGERVVLIPVELVAALKISVFILPALFLLGGFGGGLGFWANAARQGLFAVMAFVAALLAGTVLAPALLPWLPGRAFSVKGLGIGLVTALAYLASQGVDMSSWASRLEALAWLILIPAVSSFLAMNFTGASTYTSLSGVKKEMRAAVPLQIGAAATGLALWFVSLYMA